MADNDDFDGDSEENEETPKDLRAQLKKALKANKELQDNLDKLATKDRSRSISELLTSKGLNPKVAAFVPATVEADPASIDAWLEENADVFGAPRSAGDSAGEDEVDDETRQAHERMADATAGALPQGKAVDLATKIAQAKDATELNAIMQSA